MALDRLTKIDGGGISTTSDYRVGIITATKFVGPIEGAITATDGNFSGNVTIGGTLTYEDVTNIDSVGIITAQKDIHVGAGVSAVGVGTFSGLDIGGDIDVDGHTNLDNVSIAGVTTIANNKELVIGEQADSQYNTVIKQIPSGSTGSLSLTTRLPRIYSHDTRIIDIDNGNTHAYFWPNRIGLYASGSEKIQITGGSVNIINSNLSVSKDIDVDGHTNLDNVSVAGVVTATTFVGALTGTASGNTTIINPGNNKIVTSYQNNELVAEGGLTWTGAVFETNGGAETWTMRARSGASSSKIGFQNQYLANGFTVGCGAANQSFVVYTNGQNNGERLRIDQTGISTFYQNLFANKDLDVDGHTNLDNVSISGFTTFPDATATSGRLYFGNDQDMQMWHSGNDGILYSSTGGFYIGGFGTGGITLQANTIRLRNGANNEEMIKCTANGAVELYYDNVKKLETSSTGISVTGGAVFTSTDAGSSAEPELKLFRNSASPADADYLGQIKFAGESDTGVERNYAKITGKILDASNGTEDGILEFAHIKGGSQTITGRWRSDSLQLLNSTNLTVDGDLDVDRHTNLDNVSIAGVTTITGSGSSVLFLESSNPMIRLTDTDNSAYSAIGGEGGFLYFYTNTSTRDFIFRGSQEVARLTGDGLLGIGTVSPASMIHIHSGTPRITMSDSGTGAHHRINADSSAGNLAFDVDYNSVTSTPAFVINIKGSEKLRIQSDGKSRFIKDAGSTNNTYSIATEINASTSGSAAANFGPALYLTHTFGGTNYAGSLITSQCDTDVNTTHISFYPRNYGWTEAVRIKNDGKLLVGAAAIQYASSPLYVSGVNPVVGEFHHSDGGTGDQARISLGALALNPPSNRGVNLVGLNNGNGHDFVVQCSASHGLGPSEKFRIYSSGRILIGNGSVEQSPAGNLDIVGDTNSNGPELYLRVSNNNTTDNIGALLFGNNVDKSVCMIRGSTHTANNTGDIEFHTSTTGTMTEKLRIKSNGAVVIPDSTQGLRFGSAASQDFCLFHSGANSHIIHFGTGNFYQDFANDFYVRFYQTSSTVRECLSISNGGSGNPEFQLRSNPSSAPTNSGTHSPPVRFRGAGWNTNSGSVEVGTILQSEHYYWQSSVSNVFGQTYPDFKMKMKNSDNGSYVSKFIFSGNGNAAFNGSLTQNSSDIRLKENIQPITNSLEKVKSLSGFTYNWNKTAQDLGFKGGGHDELQVGLSAQDVEKIQPEVVKPAPVDNSYKTIQYEKLVPLLVEAIKEQQEQIETLQNEVNALKSS